MRPFSPESAKWPLERTKGCPCKQDPLMEMDFSMIFPWFSIHACSMESNLSKQLQTQCMCLRRYSLTNQNNPGKNWKASSNHVLRKGNLKNDNMGYSVIL